MIYFERKSNIFSIVLYKNIAILVKLGRLKNSNLGVGKK